MAWTCWDDCCGKLAGQLRVTGVQIRIVQMTLRHTLLQTVRHRHVWDATVKNKHTSVRTEPVAALHVLGGPGKQQVTEAKARYEHVGFTDLPGLRLDPLECVAGVIDFRAFTWCELAHGDCGLPILWELAVELFPEVAVGRQVLGFLLPDELQWMSEPQIVNDGRPVQLQHPQWIEQRLGCIGRLSCAIAHLAYGVARAVQRAGDLAYSAALC